MPSSYTTLLGLTQPNTGELSGTWGTTINTGITQLCEDGIAGTTTLPTDADVTLTTTVGASNQARAAVLNCTGARTAQRTITAPAQSKVYTVNNATTGGFAVKLVGVGPTTGVTVANGQKALVAWNGADFVVVAGSAIAATSVTGLTASRAVATDGTGVLVSLVNTGTGSNVLATSPALVTPDLGVATATSVTATAGFGVGATPSTSQAFRAAKTLTGSVSAQAIAVDSTALSDVTADFTTYYSAPNTAVAAFTLGTLFHYRAFQGTIGAGSSITSQLGAKVSSGLTGATNNYGYVSSIPAAANRYNFYADGTADNYMAGSLGVGIGPGNTTDTLISFRTGTGTSSQECAVRGVFTAANTSGAFNKTAGRFEISCAPGFAGTGAAIGAHGAFTLTNAVTVGSGIAVLATASATAAGSIGNMVGVQTAFGNSGGATITNSIYFYGTANTTGTNSYAFYAENTAAANRWNFFAPGTANNAYSGNSAFGRIAAPTTAVDTTSLACSIITNTAATYTVLTTDTTLIQTTAASTYTLPAAASFPGRILNLLTQFAGAVVSASSNVVPIAGGSAGTAILAATAGKYATLQSNGTNWLIIAAN